MTAATPTPRALFTALGVELEYMIVDRATLDVRPIADALLRDAAGGGEQVSDVERGAIDWSNELVNHVVELKTAEPARSPAGLAESFLGEVREADRLLAARGARLLPTGAHPWMNPHRDTMLWPHDNGPIYAAFDRIFGCQGHGWSNLQSVHVNLPFSDDEEFGRLHAAVRLLLPILPALAASTPVLEGRFTGFLDARLEHYRQNSRRIPSVAGRVIPEAVFTADDYRREIFDRIYADTAAHDPDGVLRFEWLNARGAIARFMRNTIEIRVLDIQECPAADLAIVRVVVDVLRALVAGRIANYDQQRRWPVEPLERLFLRTLAQGEQAEIDDAEYLRTLGLADAPLAAGEVWRRLIVAHVGQSAWTDAELGALEVILEQGTLATRILTGLGRPAVDAPIDSAQLRATYAALGECLLANRSYAP